MAINIPIITDFNGKGIARAKKEFEQLEGIGAKAGFAIKKAMLPATAALGALGVAAKKTVNAASDLAEAQSKVNVIFGDGADEVEAFAKTAAKSMGQSRRAVLDAAGTFGTFGKAAGLGGKDLAKFSNDFTKLASDLASFNNTTPEDAVQAIGAALRGESEPMRRFGVLLNDAALKAKAFELGIYDGSGALTDQQKILSAQALIYEQTSDAQGDFERTSDGLANSQRQLAAMLDDTSAAIGEALLPVIEDVLPYLKNFADWASNNPDKFREIATAIGGIAASVVALNTAMKASLFFKATGALGIVGVMVAAFATAYAAIESFRLGVNAQYNKWVGYIEGTVNALVSAFNPLIGLINKLIPGGNPLAKLSKISIPRLETESSRSGIPQNIRDALSGRAGKGSGFEGLNVPMMANGGIVTSPTLALIGEAGPEAVVPLDKAGAMGTTVNINVQGADPQAVVDALRTYMFRNGAVPIRVAS